MSAGTPAGPAPVPGALGLSGMLDTLEARLAEARAGTLGHAELLQVLCEDELARREAGKIARRIRAARFPEQATLEGFDWSYINEFGRTPLVAGELARAAATFDRAGEMP